MGEVRGRRYNWEDYIFACACMAGREKYLLTQDKIERMLDSKTADDAIRILRELDYGDGADGSISVAGFEDLLARELEKTYKLVVSMAPEQAYFDVLLFPNDYHNVKALLKAEFLEIAADEALIDAGSLPVEELKSLMNHRDYSNMREEMAKGIQEVLDTYGTTQDPQVIDLILDKACYRDMSLMVSELNLGFLKEYLSLKIDTINLISFIRVRNMKLTRDFFSKIFIEDGNVPAKEFLGSWDESAEQFADKMALYGLQAVVMEGLPMVRETGRFTALEKLCDDLLLSSMEDVKYITAGIEPLIAYLIAKGSEIKNVRIILAGKLAGIPAPELRERIRSTYA